MSRDEERELRQIQQETARRKRELEELQKEELRRIREIERNKKRRHREYDPEEDSAFNDDYVRERVYDPDQAVSDERFINSVYADDDDDYEEDYDEIERRDMERARRAKEKRRREARDRRLEEKEERDRIRRYKKKHENKHGFLKGLIAILLILVIVFVAAVWNITRKFNHIDSEVSSRIGAMKGSTVNILLIGQDARDGESGQRSDSIILLSINNSKKCVSMTSIMRDTYVDIPGYGGDRINASYAYGGVDLLDQTIEENFGITIDGNAMVDFEGFLEGMTAVGSLDMELTAAEAEYMNANPGLGSNDDKSDETWDLKEGMNTLTPSQVLGYSRIRYVGNSDWERTERQRKVVSGALSKVKHGHLLSGYKVASKAAPSITTDIKTMGMLRVAAGIITGGDMKSHLIPVEGTYSPQNIRGMAVLVPDIEANKNYLQKYMDGEE